MPLNCLETSFSAPLGKKKHRFYFLYHICRLIVHCFFPPRDKIMIPIIGQQAVWKPILERSSHEDALKFVEYGNSLGILRWGFKTNSAIINIYKLLYIVFLLVWFEQEKRSSRPASNHVLLSDLVCLKYELFISSQATSDPGLRTANALPFIFKPETADWWYQTYFKKKVIVTLYAYCYGFYQGEKSI